MKAGNAGSSPDGVKSDRVSASQPLRTLLDDIGGVVFALNTVVVGLDAVEKGHQKPETLNVSWNPGCPKTAARKSRRFLLESTLVRVSEVVYQFVVALSKVSRFSDVRDEWEKCRSVSKRISTIASTVLDDDDYLIPGVVLLVHWRNRVVHPNSNARLNPQQRQLLIEHKNVISTRYRGLDIELTLEHFNSGKPTLKDVSSLVAMTINLARKIDYAMQKNLSKDDLDAWLDHYQLVPMLKKIKAETSPMKYGDSACRLIRSRAPNLLDAYLQYYHT